MTIKVKCFASLREQIGVDEVEIDYVSEMTVSGVWQAISSSPPSSNTLSAVNLEYVPFDYTVTDGDEVAFFPPVTGG